MMRYECFQSESWRAEFEAFLRQGGVVNLTDVIDYLGETDFVEFFIEHVIAQEE